MKNRFKKYCLITGVLLNIVIQSANAQQSPDTIFINNVAKSFSQIVHTSQEKVYLHTDKPSYFTGDTIWLKAYVVNAITHFPNNGSRYVYVELINRKNKILRRLKIQKLKDDFFGYIPIPQLQEEGDYYLRAYTHWMLNEAPAFYYSKNIKIYASQSSFMNPSIRYEQKGKKRTAIITFKRPEGSLYVGNYVNYMVRTKLNENKFRQQQTDKLGEIKIDIPNKEEQEQYIYVVLEDKLLKYKHTFYVPNIFDYQVDFFPEGGRLIAGVTQKVGIKAIDTEGSSVNVKGAVINSRGDIITQFQSAYAGIGNFMLSTSKDEKYKAIVFTDEGLTKEFTMPKAETNAMALSVSVRNQILHYTILHTPEQPLPQKLSLLGHIRGFLLFVQPIEKEQGAVSLQSVPDGVVTFTLLDENYIPRSERLCFINQTNPIWQMTADKKSYEPRSLVSLGIRLANTSGQPLTGNFSLSVTDNYAVGCDSLGNYILPNLLLTSDLKGYIETPGYYFRNNSPRLKACLDNLMLTQGWSRFNTEEILKDRFQRPQYYMELGQMVSGKVFDIRNKPLVGKPVNVIINNRPYPTIRTDEHGVFFIDQLSFTDTTRVEAQVVEKENLFRSTIQIDRDYFPEAMNTSPYTTMKYQIRKEFIEEIQSPYIKEDGILMLRLPEVVISARTLVKDRFSSYKIDDEEMIAQQDAHTALDIVKKIPGFQIIDNRPYINPKYSRRPELLMSTDVNNRNALRPNEKINYGRTARFMLDNKSIGFDKLPLINAADIIGVHKIDPQVDDAINITQNLKNLEDAYNEALQNGATMEELEELEVDKQLQKMKDGTQNISGGCIVLTSRTGKLPFPRNNSKGDTAFLLGFNRFKTFYSPQYTTDEQRNMPTPDNRTTIYWQPQLKIDAKGNANIRFYTADRSSNYLLVIEGITDKGIPCHYEYLIKKQ